MHPTIGMPMSRATQKRISICMCKVAVYAKKIMQYEKHSANDCLPKFSQYDVSSWLGFLMAQKNTLSALCNNTPIEQ